MGVRGLLSFVENNEGLFVKDHQLHDNQIVIDANNLLFQLYIQSQKHGRRDLFGGDLVQYGRYVTSFFGNLKRCNIVPILVFDGAQTNDKNKNKTPEKHKRALDRFQRVMSINRLGFGDFILPASATNVFRSVAVDLGIRFVQSIYEADLVVARIAHELKCPVVSNDSDFLLMNLPYGLILIDLFDYEQTIRAYRDTEDASAYNYIPCWLFEQENFLKYVPGLDVECLPLLGVLAGNDFIGSSVFDDICSRISSYHDPRTCANNFTHINGNKQHQKIAKILHFMANKTLNELMNLVCAQAPKDKRSNLKNLIKSNLLVYKIPDQDDFESELRTVYWKGFQLTQKNNGNQEELSSKFDRVMKTLVDWLRNSMEKSVLGYRCLELLSGNVIFIINHMDDPQLPSAHQCQIRTMRVMMALLKSCPNDRLRCIVYDRVGQSYSKKIVLPLDELENFGPLKLTFYDLPRLPDSIRLSILMATFHTTTRTFQSSIGHYYGWFEPYNAEEFLLIKVIMDFVDVENRTARLWKHFRQATLLCVIYYFYKCQKDAQLVDHFNQGPSSRDGEFMQNFLELVKRRRLDKMPTLNKKRKYNCRLMHQITQLQSSIISYNGLNAFLGDVMNRVRTENWLNSCLIYNLTEQLHNKTLRLPYMPEIIHLMH